MALFSQYLDRAWVPVPSINCKWEKVLHEKNSDAPFLLLRLWCSFLPPQTLMLLLLLLRGFAKFRLFAMFPVLLTILIMWALCAILTQVLINKWQGWSRQCWWSPRWWMSDGPIKTRTATKTMTVLIMLIFHCQGGGWLASGNPDGRCKAGLARENRMVQASLPLSVSFTTQHWSPILSNHPCTKMETRIMCTSHSTQGKKELLSESWQSLEELVPFSPYALLKHKSPVQWGLPTVSAEGVLGMMAGVLVS